MWPLFALHNLHIVFVLTIIANKAAKFVTMEVYFTLLLAVFAFQAAHVLALNETALDCHMKLLSLRMATQLQPQRSTQRFRQIYDALQLEDLCNISFTEAVYEWKSEDIFWTPLQPKETASTATPCATDICLYVEPRNNHTSEGNIKWMNDLEGDGSLERPLCSIHAALALSRRHSRPYNTTIGTTRASEPQETWISMASSESQPSEPPYRNHITLSEPPRRGL